MPPRMRGGGTGKLPIRRSTRVANNRREETGSVACGIEEAPPVVVNREAPEAPPPCENQVDEVPQPRRSTRVTNSRREERGVVADISEEPPLLVVNREAPEVGGEAPPWREIPVVKVPPPRRSMRIRNSQREEVPAGVGVAEKVDGAPPPRIESPPPHIEYPLPNSEAPLPRRITQGSKRPREGALIAVAEEIFQAPPPREEILCSEVVLQCQSPMREEDGDHDHEREADSGDDCAVVGDNDAEDDGEANDEDMNGLGVEEGNLEDDFREAANDEEAGSDADSGDDIWDDERIPDPLSSDEEEDEIERERCRENDDPEELLTLGKTFNSTEDFKLAVLRYSLKTRYDVKLYRSQATKVGAKCADTDVECP